jgi:hypothetical protein
MTRTSSTSRAVAALVAVAILLLGACSDDDTADDSPTTTAPSELGGGDADDGDADDGDADDGDAPDPGGNPVTDDVTIEIAGLFDQTFRGGFCTIADGILQIAAGYATGIGPNRPQGSPYANATVQLMGPAEDGEHDTGFALVGMLESDDSVVLDQAPSVTIEPGFLSGTFESPEVTGSFTCPTVLTAEQLNDLVADHSGE